MINFRVISKILGKLLFLEAFMLLISWAVGWCYGEWQWTTFGLPIAITAAAGALLLRLGRGSDDRVNRRDGYVIVSCTWLLFSAFGMLPLLFGHHVQDGVADAFLETMSGFTTTGATVLNNIDTLPHGILFWRSLTHWIGGLGIVVFTVAFLPSLGGNNLKLFTTEATGISHERINPRISTTAKWLWLIYVTLTAMCTLLLWAGGMSLFDAVNHAFSTMGTGGFSTRQDGIVAFQSPLIEYILIVFMFLASLNFSLLYLTVLKRHWKDFWHDEELRFYCRMLGGGTLALMFGLVMWLNYPLEQAFRQSLFTLLSLQSTTGFVSCDYMLWPTALVFILLLGMVVGGCAGSTSGGVKCVRVLSFYKVLVSEIKLMIHPQAVVPPAINHHPLTAQVIRRLLAYAFAFALIAAVGTIVIAGYGYPLLDSFSITVSSFSNVGPAIGYVFGAFDTWESLPVAVKWMCSIVMLLGRLEIFSLVLPLIPAFWQKH